MEKLNDQATNNGVHVQEEIQDPAEDEVNMDEDDEAKEKLTADPTKVQFTSVKMDGYGNTNGEAKVDIRVVSASVGMGKEELMKYANEPYWVRLRFFLFFLFWLCWVAMLVGAVVIIVLAPRCPPPPHLMWYQKSAMYDVQLQSFKDSNGDGIGDIQGLISKLNYFKDLNIGTLLLSAFYSMAPNSNGIVNHTSIDNRYGTMEDFSQLLDEMKAKDMKLVIDFIPNHSSDKHPWFEASVRKEAPYTNFYIWASGNDDKTPPSKWLNVKDESAWVWNEDREQFYLNTFGKDQPDLNLTNQDVRDELKEIMEFWLKKGIDGFKVVAASNLVENDRWWDEPVATEKGKPNPKYKDFEHAYTKGQPENFELLAEWRTLMSNFSTTDMPKVLMAEVSESVNSSVRYYGNSSHPLVDIPINVQLTKLTMDSTASDLLGYILSWLSAMPAGTWPNCQLGNEHTDRLAARVGPELIDGIHMVAALSKGTPIVYYGDELGINYDPIDGKPEVLNQSPMQWNTELYAGFTNGSKTYTAVNPNYETVNVEMQEKEKSSHLKIFQHLMAMRSQPAITLGIQEYPINNTEGIFTLMRVRKGSPGYLVVLNMGMNATNVDFTGKDKHLPEKGRVEVRSLNINDGPLAETDHPKVKLNEIFLKPKQAVVLSFVPVFGE